MFQDEPQASDEVSASTEGQTSLRTRNRLELFASVVGALLLIGYGVFVFLAGLGAVSLGAVPQAWFTLTTLVILLAGTQVFGRDVLSAVNEFRGN